MINWKSSPGTYSAGSYPVSERGSSVLARGTSIAT
jgi:hypothetical protein